MLECWMHIFCHLIIAGVIQVSGGLSWVRVTVPHYRVPGEMAQLLCDYELGEDTLYSVKWYKDHEEFYRFVPKALPPQHSYRLDGLQVDLSLSDSRKVVLRALTLKSSGLYRCEVSAEAPSFASAQAEARMEVVYLPKEDPQISGVELQYQIGDEINLNCTSGKSHPASILHWYINEQQVVSPDALVRYPPVIHRHSLVSSTLGLRFTLSSRHFLGGSMRVKCVASVSPLMWQGGSESVVQRLAPLIDNREALLLVKSAASERIRLCATVFLLQLVLILVSIM